MAKVERCSPLGARLQLPLRSARAAGRGDQAIIFRAETLTKIVPAPGLLLVIDNGRDDKSRDDQDSRDDEEDSGRTHGSGSL